MRTASASKLSSIQKKQGETDAGRPRRTQKTLPHAAGKRKAAILLAQGHTPELLALVFQRIYTLRNQLMHGGATWHGKTNRAQVQDCATLMAHIVPVVVDIMLLHPDAVWGEACYPVI